MQIISKTRQCIKIIITGIRWQSFRAYGADCNQGWKGELPPPATPVLNHRGGGKSLLLLTHPTKLQWVTKTISKNNKICKQNAEKFLLTPARRESCCGDQSCSSDTEGNPPFFFLFYQLSEHSPTTVPPPWICLCWNTPHVFCFFSYKKVTHSTQVRVWSNPETSGYTRPTTFFTSGCLPLFFSFGDHDHGLDNIEQMRKEDIRKPTLL